MSASPAENGVPLSHSHHVRDAISGRNNRGFEPELGLHDHRQEEEPRLETYFRERDENIHEVPKFRFGFLCIIFVSKSGMCPNIMINKASYLYFCV